MSPPFSPGPDPHGTGQVISTVRTLLRAEA
ncbi:hypothetical protein SAMN05216505_101215 [Streptomyces prasinopilosus]|uniref:Uncharacterized protein n=1 Tax=Streptomyces prasinopilosus TaxID=67344 RepID=A0A1G6IF38_9ACTN|nr:hypothetical protein SAMN05216505_101215 [Streptomyces prasinopilosus]